MKVRFTKDFAHLKSGIEKDYADVQYATWLISIDVAEPVIEVLKMKEIKSVPETKEEKHVVKRQTKHAKG